MQKIKLETNQLWLVFLTGLSEKLISVWSLSAEKHLVYVFISKNITPVDQMAF